MWTIHLNKENKIIKEIGDSNYIYQNVLHKACFQHNMAYGDFKDLNRRTATDKVLCEKHLILLKIQNMMNINKELLQCFTNVFIKKLKMKLRIT